MAGPIARDVAHQPDLMLADEPVASMDPRIGAGTLELLRVICHAERSGAGVICSLHQPRFAKQFADRVVGLSAGRIVVNTAAADFAETAPLDVCGNTPADDASQPPTAARWATA